jgi:uncharacterized zinc-type alcohol dehydrogenase-like protein
MDGGSEMTVGKVTGYAAKAKGAALEPLLFEQPELGKRDMRISVTHCGLCYTDVQGIEDYYGITKYPFVPGHEIVGIVSELGSSSVGLKVGDRIGIGWLGRPCMHCEWCLKGEEQLCINIVKAATWLPYGGFSSSMVVNSDFVHLLPESIPSEMAAVLMCAGITVYSPLRSHAKGASLKIGIVGVGGLGHLAIQFAHALGYEVTAISSSPAKKDEAMSFGADHFLAAHDETALTEKGFYFDLLLCTAHGNLKWEPLVDVLKKRGTLLLVGFPDIALNATDLVAHEVSITGSFLGNAATMSEMLLFVQEHNITPRVEQMPMRMVNEAIKRLKENKARYRIVLTNE